MAADESQKSPVVDWWDRAKTASGIIAAIIIPIVVLVVGSKYTAALKDRELEGKFVELALSILREQPNPQALELRRWAAKVIDKYSGVPLSQPERKDLIETTPLPGGSAAVRDVQAMLVALGYYTGPVDGLIGPSLREAVIKYQKAHKLPGTGIMDSPTINAMIGEFTNLKRQSK